MSVAYTLENDVSEGALEGVRSLFRDLGAGRIFDNGHDTCFSWYGYEDFTLHEISESYPEFNFILYGVDKTVSSVWRKRFRAGRLEKVRAKIVWPEFTELTDE